tara:strand:- start:1100 stop:1690 length:591 start_codon:yes stop_codon:yes gene_type:complete
MKIPELAFLYAYPLDGLNRRNFEEEGKEYPTRPEIRETMTHWRNLWSETNNEKGIIAKMVELTKRTPTRNLECFVFGAGLNAMSTPFLMPTRNRKGNKWTDEYFVQTITHELLHIFLTTDTDEYWNMVRDKYSNEEPSCQNHIVLYAMLYELYQDCFNQEPPDFSRDNLPPGYMRAIEIVKEAGSKELVAEYSALV